MADPALGQSPRTYGPAIAAGVLFAVACSVAGAQTFVIVTPDGARLSAATASAALRFDDERPASEPAVGAALTGSPPPGNFSADADLAPIGATMPQRPDTGDASWPRADSLNLSLDVTQFLPAPVPERSLTRVDNDTSATRLAAGGDSFGPSGGAPAGELSAISLVAAPSVDAVSTRKRARAAHSGADDLALKFNVRGFSLLSMDGDADADLQFRRVREREWRRPLLSLTIQKRF